LTTLSRSQLEARILLEEDGLIAVNKCPDLPTSGRSLDDEDCLQHALLQRCGSMVWAVHQLDADTSGVNLFTTKKSLVEPLKRAMGREDAAKWYVAIVHGVPAWTERQTDAPIGQVSERSLGVTPEGRPASSTFRVLARGSHHSLIRASIATGRTHQIRIHLASLGYPLVGEEWYGERPCKVHPRQALHACRLRIHGPHAIDVVAPMPDDLRALAQGLDLSLVQQSERFRDG
jgi:RluA family pseudouridine synthase